MVDKNNVILKLSNKKNQKQKTALKHQIQTQLIDIDNKKVKSNSELDDLENQSKRSLSEGPQSQSKINAIIYNQQYDSQNEIGVSNINEIDSQNVPVVNRLKNVTSYPIAIDCPYCNKNIQSNVDSNCNCFTFFLILIMIIIFPLMCIASIYKAGTGTSTCSCCSGIGDCDCCNDVKHVCPNCGKVIAESDSCSRLFNCTD